MQKVVNKKTKVSLKSNIMVQDLNIYYPRNYYLSNNIV